MMSYVGTALFAIVVLVLLVFGKGGIAGDVRSSSAIVTDDLVLLNMLRTPITVENSNMTLSDLIVLWRFDEDEYEDVLEENVDSILNSSSFDFKEKKKMFEKHYDFVITDRPPREVILKGVLFMKIEDLKEMPSRVGINTNGSISTMIPVSIDESVWVMLRSYKVRKE